MHLLHRSSTGSSSAPSAGWLIQSFGSSVSAWAIACASSSAISPSATSIRTPSARPRRPSPPPLRGSSGRCTTGSSSDRQALDDAQLTRYAAELGLDTERFRRELTEQRHRARVQDDVLSGLHSGVRGTPMFFINGMRHDGRWELQDLLAAIAAADRYGTPDELGPAPDIAADEVTLASWESFPASDAPGWQQHP